MMLLKCCTQYASKFGKLSSGHRSGKGQCQRMFKLLHNATHTTRLQSNTQNSPSQASTVCELPDVQAGFKKGRGTRDQLLTSIGS